MKKTITLLLVLALSAGLLAACGSTEIHSYQEDAQTEDIFANALTAYAPDTLVATADGTPVHWNEFAYWLAYIGSQIAVPDENGKIDWYAAEGSEEPLAETLLHNVHDSIETLLHNVHDSILQYHILEGMAAEKGVEFGEEGEEYVQSMIQDAITGIAGEEGTEEDLAGYLKDYYLDLISGNKKISISTLSRLDTILKPMVEMAVNDDIILKNPFRGVIGEIRGESHFSNRKIPALTAKQQNAFMDFVFNMDKHIYIRNMIIFLLGTGCRIGETVGLRWSDIDFDRNTVSINHAVGYIRQNGHYRQIFKSTKSKAGENRLIIEVYNNSGLKITKRIKWKK